MGSARRTSRCPAGRLRRAACLASGAVCGPAATAQCGRAAPPTSPLGRRAARDPHSAWDDCSAESHGVSQPRSRLRGLRGGALAWARMSTARTAAAAGPPRCETRGSRAPSAGRAMPSAGPCLALDAPPPQPRVRAHARTVFCAKPGVGEGGSPPAPAARGTLARPAVYLLSAVHGTSQARGRMSEKVCKPDTRARCALRSRRGSQLGVTGPPRSFATSGDIFVVVTDMRGGVVRI